MEQISLLMTDLAPEVTKQCTAALEQRGIRVTVCEKDGRKALAAIEKQRPNAVLLAAGGYLVIAKANVAGAGATLRATLCQDGVPMAGGSAQTTSGGLITLPLLVSTVGSTLTLRNDSTETTQYSDVSMTVVRLDA